MTSDLIDELTSFLTARLDKLERTMMSRADRQAVQAVDDRIAEVRSAVDRVNEACVEMYRVMDGLPPETRLRCERALKEALQ